MTIIASVANLAILFFQKHPATNAAIKENIFDDF